MRGAMSDLEAISSRNLHEAVEVLFDYRVFEYMLSELAKYPTVEDGGKFIGHIIEPQDTSLKLGNLLSYRVVIQDFLPGGPNAKRTSVEFMPDGEHQERLFRQAEQHDPHIEHVDTWHSHHCNGLNPDFHFERDGPNLLVLSNVFIHAGSDVRDTPRRHTPSG